MPLIQAAGKVMYTAATNFLLGNQMVARDCLASVTGGGAIDKNFTDAFKRVLIDVIVKSGVKIKESHSIDVGIAVEFTLLEGWREMARDPDNAVFD
eukprot:5234004-Amphidinium_carterae.1